MNTILEYFFIGIVLVFVGYIFYQQITSHPSDKYHNDSWKEDRKRRNK
jgi:hypothetical protein